MKFVCSVCGYVYEGDAAPAVCPVCASPAVPSDSRKVSPGNVSSLVQAERAKHIPRQIQAISTLFVLLFF